MSTHRFILEPYKGVSTRHTCPNCHRKRCFSKYIDTEKQIQFPDYVGRCDHEQKCGYHFTPRDYFERNPSEKEKLSEDTFRNYTPIKEVEPKVTSYIDLDIVNQSLQRYPDNKLFQFLSAQFGEAETLKLMEKYKVGTSKHWDGATVFWQTDYQNRVRTGKIMLYNTTTGRRIKRTIQSCHVGTLRITQGGLQFKSNVSSVSICFQKIKNVLSHWSKARKRQSLLPTTYPNFYGLHRVERTVVSMPTAYPFLPEEALCYFLIWERPTIGKAKSG